MNTAPRSAIPRLLDAEQAARVRGATLVVLAVGGGLAVLAGVGEAWGADRIVIACVLGLVLHLVSAQLGRWFDPDRRLAGMLALDTALFTWWLSTTGGSYNAMSLLYLSIALMAAFGLPRREAWGVTALTVAAFGWLYAGDAPHAHHAHHDMASHLLGMYLAYVAVAVLLTGAVLRARAALAEAARQEARARALQERTQRVAALASLAAGAAHELATPLSTILLVAGELERTSEGEAREDLALIREEVERCRGVLGQLSAEAGAGMGEAGRWVSLEGLAAEIVDRDVPDLVVQTSPPGASVQAPVRLLGQVVRRLVGNARRASAAGVQVRLELACAEGELVISVIDEGTGMSPEVVERAVEPFFTTRAPGEGTGLGLFFVHSVAEHLGGSLTLRSKLGEGTTACLRLPLPCRAEAIP
jgi:two-component system sensor histidine kinase RegB